MLCNNFEILRLKYVLALTFLQGLYFLQVTKVCLEAYCIIEQLLWKIWNVSKIL